MLQSIPLICKDAWITLIDLQAYFYIFIHLQHRHFLQFSVGDSSVSHFLLVLTVPQVFTKRMAVVVAAPHFQGISIYPYIEEWLLVSTSYDVLPADFQITLSFLSQLGLQVNLLKLQLIPSQHLLFIRVDTDTQMVKAITSCLWVDIPYSHTLSQSPSSGV